MATLAAICDRLLQVGSAERTASRAASRGCDEAYTLRAFPNEEVCFWVQEVDNSRVARQANPQSWNACWKFILTTCMGVLLLVGVLLPHAYSVLAGYQIHSLVQDRRDLLNKRQALELEEARLLSPERLAELARIQNFVDPPSDGVVQLSPPRDGSLALGVGQK